MKFSIRLIFSALSLAGCVMGPILGEASADTRRSVGDRKGPNHVIVVIDASASMGRLTSGVSHLNAVKEALGSLLQQGVIPANVDMWSFGARLDQSNKENSCQDIELLSAGVTEGRTSLRAQINSLEPRGYTSIALALDRASKVIKEGQTRIILITDGEERCGGDPLKVATAIRHTSKDAKLHIIGLSLDFETKQSLLTLADAGGGKLFQPKEMSDVASSIRDALESE